MKIAVTAPSNDSGPFRQRFRLTWRRAAAPFAVLFVTCLAVGGIVSTYRIFNQVSDEPAHIAAGMEWLQYGTYVYEPLHPPLARTAVALGPYLLGLRLHGERAMWEAGNDILYSGRYFRNLAAARLGVLPFFVLGVCVVYMWARRLFGDGAALAAVALFASCPPVLAHAGLATTDMPLAATTAAALLAFVVWLERPTRDHGLILGFTTSLAVLTKFSAVGYLPVCWLTIVVLKWLLTGTGASPRIEPAGWGKKVWTPVLTAALVIWADYRFSFGALTRPHRVHPLVASALRLIDRLPGPHTWLDRMAAWGLTKAILPAPELFRGLYQFYGREVASNYVFVLGKLRTHPPWFFFPLGLGLKTPLPMLGLAALGLVWLVRKGIRERQWMLMVPAAAAVSILLVGMSSRLALGLRHILPIYPLLAVLAGSGAWAAWQGHVARKYVRALITALFVWQVAATAAAWPDFLPYFNLLAGSHPGRFLVHEDLDWGQDLSRLGAALRARGVERAWLAYFGTAEPWRSHSPQYLPLPPNDPECGWVAVSEFNYRYSTAYAWLSDYHRVPWPGKSIRLYFVDCPAPAPGEQKPRTSNPPVQQNACPDREPPGWCVSRPVSNPPPRRDSRHQSAGEDSIRPIRRGERGPRVGNSLPARMSDVKPDPPDCSLVSGQMLRRKTSRGCPHASLLQ